MSKPKDKRRASGGLVVFAHVPPPHHGQSWMIQLMLEGLGGSQASRGEGRELQAKQGTKNPPQAAFPVFHVDARVSDGLEDVGGIRPGKILRLFKFCLQAIWLRVRHGADTLYYVPAPRKTSAIARDWIVMLLVRPWFRRLVLHWHAVGLGAWASSGGSFSTRLTRRLLSGADPAIVIAGGNRADAEVFEPTSVRVIPNGIPDPCPDYAEMAQARTRRSEKVRGWIGDPATQPAGERVRILFLGQCTAEKGYPDALAGVKAAVGLLGKNRLQLDIAGTFVSAEAREESGQVYTEMKISLGIQIRSHGFLDGEDKKRLLRESDILLFPSHSESFGLVAAEALACGLPVIASDIPGLNAVLGDTPCARVPAHNPQAIANALASSASYVPPDLLRARYETEFTLDRFQRRIAAVLLNAQ